MLKITPETKDGRTGLRLEGKLSDSWVEEFRRCWQLLATQTVSVDLAGVVYIDSQGANLLHDMYLAGVELNGAQGAMVRQIVMEAKRGHGEKNGHRAVVAILMLCAMLCLQMRVVAQTAEPLRLSLKQAVQLALKQSPESQMAAIDLATQRAGKSEALAGLLPQAMASTSISAMKYNTDIQIGHYITGFPRSAGPYEVFGAGGAFTMPVFDLTLWRRYQAQGDAVRAASAGQMGVREQIALLVVSQYLGCQKAAADVEAAHSRVELAQTLDTLAQHMLANGVGTSIDELRASVQLQSERQHEIVAHAVEETSLYGLERLLNLDPGQSVELTDKLEDVPEKAPAAELMWSKALTQRPEMKALEAKQVAAHRMRQAAQESRLPTLGAGGAWGYLGTSAGTALPSYTYTVTAYVPLFTGGRIHAENVKADLAEQRLDQERVAMRQRIIFEVRAAATQLAAAQNEVKVAYLALDLSRQEVTQAKDRFAAGAANNVELSMAQDALARSSDGYTAALYREHQAMVDLAHAIGETELSYSK